MALLKQVFVGFAAVLLLAPIFVPNIAYAGAAKPTINIANPGECIAPAAEMRRNHMEMLKHQRDRTVRLGIRGEKASIKDCVNCHASKTTGSVLGAGGFCQECHSYAAVNPDCWDCHQPKAGHDKRADAAGVKP